MYYKTKHNVFIISRGAEGRTGDIAMPPVCPSVCPSVCLSVTFSFRTVTQKRIDVFSRNFAGTCTMSWGCCIVFDIDGMLLEFFMNFLNIEKIKFKNNFVSIFHVFFAFHAISNIKKKKLV